MVNMHKILVPRALLKLHSPNTVSWIIRGTRHVLPELKTIFVFVINQTFTIPARHRVDFKYSSVQTCQETLIIVSFDLCH